MQNKYNEQIVISAFGCVTPLGHQYEDIRNALFHGRSGIKAIEKFDCSEFITKHAGIPDEGNEAIRWPRASRIIVPELFYADLAAKRLKLHEAFPKNYYKPDDLGCFIGIDEPAIDIQLCFDFFTQKQDGQNESKLFNLLSDKMKISDCMNLDPPAALTAIHRHIPFSSLALCHVGLCSASLQSIGMAMQAIADGRIEAAIAGGVSGKVNPMNLARLELIDAISTDVNLSPEARSRPFDSRRSGFVLAEGAVLFLIEKASHLKKRQEKAYLSLLGYGSSLAAEHIVAPHKTSFEMEACMRRALHDAQIKPEQIDLINAHGTSTQLNDMHEALAIQNIFADYPVKVTANKSLHGHLIASAGAMEVLNSLISVNEGFVPGTINLENQDPRCLVNVVKNTEVNPNINFILKNSFGMGGLAASLVMGKVKHE